MSFPRLGLEQAVHALDVVRSASWGEVNLGIGGLEEGLRRALVLTESDFAIWERDLENRLAGEYSFDLRDVRRMNPRRRAAYVARLLRSVASHYGLEDDPPLQFVSVSTPAGLLRALNDAVHLPRTVDEDAVTRPTPKPAEAVTKESPQFGVQLIRNDGAASDGPLETIVGDINDPGWRWQVYAEAGAWYGRVVAGCFSPLDEDERDLVAEPIGPFARSEDALRAVTDRLLAMIDVVRRR